VSTHSFIPPRQLLTLVTLIACLVAVLLLKSRCGPATEGLFRALEAPLAVDGGVAHD
jgi:hypothetical protein